MQRFFTYAAKYCTLTFEEKQFINAHTRIRRYNKNDYYQLAHEIKTNWCFVLDGVVAGVKTNLEGDKRLQWLSVKNQYFTGTKHVFSKQNLGLQLQFLQQSELLEFPYHYIQKAQQEYPAFAELLQVLKEQKLKCLHELIATLKLPPEQRVQPALENLSVWVSNLHVEECCSLLNISIPTYYIGLNKYLKQS
jgi:CRP-like cAMP-binding protein